MILLEDRSVLKIDGSDSLSFLQGLVTCDVTIDKPLIYGAMLTPQGKIRFDFFLYKQEKTALMDVATFQLEDVKKILRLYKLRADVTISEQPELAVVASLNSDNEEGHLLPDPRLTAMGYRSIRQRSELIGSPLLPLLTYHKHRIHCGIPDSSDFITDRAFIAEYGLDRLNGVSFTKGCYVGQEVVARTKHRGTVHKSLHQVFAKENPLPAADTPILAGEKEIGILRHSLEGEGLAILHRTKLAKTNEKLIRDI